jgi:hypothetical protein
MAKQQGSVNGEVNLVQDVLYRPEEQHNQV